MSDPTPPMPLSSASSDVDDLPPLPPTAPSPAAYDGTTIRTPAVDQFVPVVPDVPGYQILGELGRGRFGVVYKARHLALNRLVALKVIRDSELADDAERERFRAEAETVARLHRPDVVQIHDIGSGRGQLPYLALEYVEGGTLAQKIGGTPQPAGETAALVEKLARAVQAVHDEGIIHRDLKPSNVLLGADGQPKIGDFGLARALSHNDKSLPTGLMGTACYMPPEQALVQNTALRSTADIYALGAILYEMLTGRPPFMGENPMDTLQQVIQQYPVPPTRLQPRVPPDLEVICLKCLEKEPGRRYASAGDLADDLARFRKREPIMARPTGALTRGWRWCQRNPAVAASLAVVALAWVSATVICAFFAVSEYHEGQRRLKAEKDLEEKNLLLEGKLKELKETNLELQQKRRLGDHLLYAVTMNLIRRALDEGDTELAQGLLERGGFSEAVHGFEWHHVNRVFANHLRSIRAHGSEVTALSISADGRWLASGTARFGDGDRARAGTPAELRIWELATGKAADAGSQVTAPGFWSAVTALQFADGANLWAGCPDRLIFVKDGVEADTLRPEEAPVWKCVALHPGGKRLAMAAVLPLGAALDPINAHKKRSRIYGFATDTGVALRQPPLDSDHAAEPVSLAFAQDLPLLACGYADGAIEVWDFEARALKAQFRGRLADAPAAVLAFSPDGRRVACGDGADIRVKDLTDNSEIVLEGHSGPVTALAFHPDNRHLSSGSTDRCLRIWDLDRKRPPRVYTGHAVGLTRVAVSPDGTRVVTADSAGILMVWDPQAPPAMRVLSHQRGPFRGVAWGAAGKYLAAGRTPLPYRDVDQGPDGVVVFDAATGQVARRLGENLGYARQLVLHAQKPLLAAVLGSDTVYLWSSDTGQAWEPLPSIPDACACAFHPDGERLVVVLALEPRPNTGEAEVRFYDLRTGQYKPAAAAYTPHTGHATPRYGRFVLAVSPDGKWLATGKDDGTIVIWDAATGKAGSPFTAHDGPVTALAFDADGKRLVSGGQDRLVKVWDRAKQVPLLTCRGHLSAIEGVVVHPRGGWLASCSQDGTVKTWDAEMGLELFTLRGHEGAVTGLAFDPDGHRLATASRDGTVRLWDGQPLPKAR